MNKTLILVVEDDRPIRNLIVTTLKTHDYKYLAAENGSSAILEASSHNPDIVLLDLGLPDMEGVEVIKKIRTWSNMPIIVISARSEDTDKIEALDAGADDYITKPFSIKELMARINRIILRNKKNTIIQVQNIKFDMDKMVVYRDNENVELTNLELKILNLLFLNLNKVVKRSEIIDKIWEWTGNDVNDNTVTVYLKRIREKIKTDIIITIKGIGYRIDSEVD